MATFGADLRKTAARKIGNAVFGSGMVGGALNKAFAKKFGGGDQKDTQVADALSEQAKEQETVNSALGRIELTVMNIADNIYNIAGVWSKHVASMEEARKAQRERMSREAAAKEEAASEMQATRIEAPGTAGTKAPTEEDKKKGPIGKIMSALSSTRGVVGKLLKRFALVTGGALLAAGVGGAAMATVFSAADSAFGKEDAATLEPSPSDLPTEDGGETTTTGTSTLTGAQPQPSTSSSAPPPSSPTSAAAQSTLLDAQAKEGAMYEQVQRETSSAAPPAATPVAQPAMPATAPPAPPQGADSLPAQAEEFFNKPENIAYKVQLEAVNAKIKGLNQSILTTEAAMIGASPEDTKRHKATLSNLKTQLANAEDEKDNLVKSAMNSTPQAVASMVAGQTAPELSTSSTPSAATSAAPASTSSATPIPPSPSTGTEISQASVDVAAAGEPQPQGDAMVTNNGEVSDGKPAPPMPMPSPIADRGSLDIGTTFRSGI